MKLKLGSSVFSLFSKINDFFELSDMKLKALNEEPMREELFSSDQMEDFGKTLAKRHKLSTKPAKDHLLVRLAENEIVLQGVRKLITDSIKNNLQITPAGEWLIDNFYLIEEQIKIAKTYFPKNYSEDLPQLQNGTSSGFTRSYDIVLQIISHSDGRVDIESLGCFIEAYQTVSKLKLGELWSIPIMLRLALIENIRRVSALIAIDKVNRNLADYWCKKLIDTAEKSPKELILVLGDMARSNPPIVGAFVSEIIRQLRGKGPDLALVLNWLEQQLSGSGVTGAELVNAENQKQATDQVSISNSIGSLRLLGAIDWRTFVEAHSIVDKILIQDHSKIYGLMDFSTRDHYRHVVEHISKKSKLSEEEVARIVKQLSIENTPSPDGDQSIAHVGYYLIGEGLAQTKKRAKMHVSVFNKFQDSTKKHAFLIYLFFILSISLGIGAAIFFKVQTETNIVWLLFLVSILALLSASQLAISTVNFFATLLVKPNLLPRMDYSEKIPSSFSTMVVIPSMLTTVAEIEDLVEALEVRFLANRKEHLYFGLLTDFTDAVHETLPDDQMLLDTVKNGIEALNKKYQREKNDLFFLFHRPRKWNQQENAWMGYERKRGKLSDLNALLKGISTDNFSLIIGEQSIFSKIKYVITLDTDTQLPLNSAWKLIGTIAHPLNHAWYDEKKKRVIKGYGILQPRVAVSLPDITGSRYARMHGNEPGIDPYTRASSDVYQDLFGEGSYIGKGIYDVDIFQQVLDGKFLENQILSHDLLEGCYIRSGLLSDVQLFEKYPTTYSADMKMQTRWIRGDWQIFSWILPWVKSSEKHLQKNPISALSRWKIFDNMRRSLVPIALTLLLLVAWLVLPSALFWTIAVSGIIVFPIFVSSVFDALRKPKDVVLKYHIKNSMRNFRDSTIKTLFTLICLPYEAFANLKAILITLWRMIVSRKNLLEWNPSAHAKKAARPSLVASYHTMWIEPVLAVVILLLLAIYAPQNIIIAAPILLLWFIAPYITWFASKPLEKKLTALSGDQIMSLQKLARKTWSYFDHFVGDEDNWLAPDNYQEQPIEQIAHRTSPTNIGLSLLANLSANEFGYITTEKFIERTSNTINTMLKMERYNGHFYNWYDTKSMLPLPPKYISTVDSGNLAGHLLVLKQGLLALPHQKILSQKLFIGLRDTFRVLIDTITGSNIELPKQLVIDLDAICSSEIRTLVEIQKDCVALAKEINSFVEKLNSDPNSETYRWKQLLIDEIDQINQHLLIFSPWFLLQSAPSTFQDITYPDANISWNEFLINTKELQTNLNNWQKGSNNQDENQWLELMHPALTNSSNTAYGLIRVCLV